MTITLEWKYKIGDLVAYYAEPDKPYRVVDTVALYQLGRPKYSYALANADRNNTYYGILSEFVLIPFKEGNDE